MPSRRARWASACSTTSRSRRSTRSTRTGSSACSCSTGTCTTATARTPPSTRRRRCCSSRCTSGRCIPGRGPASDVGSGAGAGYTVNLPVAAGAGDALYASLLEHVVAPLALSYRPQLILISAGFDAHRDDPLAGVELTEDGFAALAGTVRRLAAELEAPVGAVLEGGYDLSALAASTAATLRVLTAPDPPRGGRRAARAGGACRGRAARRALAGARGRLSSRYLVAFAGSVIPVPGIVKVLGVVPSTASSRETSSRRATQSWASSGWSATVVVGTAVVGTVAAGVVGSRRGGGRDGDGRRAAGRLRRVEQRHQRDGDRPPRAARAARR